MRELLTKYGRMPIEIFEQPFENLDSMNQEQLFDKLLDFHNNEYTELYRIFRLPLDNSPNGPELWDRYFAAKKYDFIEMQMLAAQAKICRTKWKSIFGIKNKNLNKNKKKVTNGQEEKAEHDDNTKITDGISIRS